MKRNVITGKPKTKGNSNFLIDTSTPDRTNDIAGILDTRNFDMSVIDNGYIKDNISEKPNDIVKDVNKVAESIVDMKAEFYVLKWLVVEEICNINIRLDCVRVECNHTECKNDMGVKLQTKTEIIKAEKFSDTVILSYTGHETNSNQNLTDHFQSTKSDPSKSRIPWI